VATPARSTTDTPVTASDPDRRPSQLAPGLVARGRYIAEAHRKATGNDIGANELAVKLRVSTSRARQVLAALTNTTQPASANGNRPTAAVPG
jgi:citrate lyase beta subunit